MGAALCVCRVVGQNLEVYRGHDKPWQDVSVCTDPVKFDEDSEKHAAFSLAESLGGTVYLCVDVPPDRREAVVNALTDIERESAQVH